MRCGIIICRDVDHIKGGQVCSYIERVVVYIELGVGIRVRYYGYRGGRCWYSLRRNVQNIQYVSNNISSIRVSMDGVIFSIHVSMWYYISICVSM